MCASISQTGTAPPRGKVTSPEEAPLHPARPRGSTAPAGPSPRPRQAACGTAREADRGHGSSRVVSAPASACVCLHASLCLSVSLSLSPPPPSHPSGTLVCFLSGEDSVRLTAVTAALVARWGLPVTSSAGHGPHHAAVSIGRPRPPGSYGGARGVPILSQDPGNRPSWLPRCKSPSHRSEPSRLRRGGRSRRLGVGRED